MNIENLEYLKERMQYLGFGDKLNANLEKNIAAEKDQFNLSVQGEFNKNGKKEIVEYTVDFTKSKQADMYFANNYKATLKNDDPEKEKSQVFYLNKGNGVTAKEAYNMLEGRAVHKKLTNRENEPYEAWLQLNFAQKDDKGSHKIQQYHSNWGYDLQKALEKHPVKALADPEKKDQLIKSLEKGNLVQVTYNRSEKDEKMFLEANPKERNITLYDGDMRKQFQGIKEFKEEKKDTKQGQDENKSQQKSKDDDPKKEPDSQKPKGKRMSA